MSKELVPVNPEMAALMLEMNPQHIALLILKILYPEKPLYELAKDVWPDVGGAMRRKRIHESRVNNMITSIANRPYQLALIMNSKLMPLAVATLYEGLSADKENVRVTAAKEIIRLAQLTAGKLNPDDNEPLPVEALDEALEAEYRVIEDGSDVDARDSGDSPVESDDSGDIPGRVDSEEGDDD